MRYFTQHSNQHPAPGVGEGVVGQGGGVHHTSCGPSGKTAKSSRQRSGVAGGKATALPGCRRFCGEGGNGRFSLPCGAGLCYHGRHFAGEPRTNLRFAQTMLPLSNLRNFNCRQRVWRGAPFWCAFFSRIGSGLSQSLTKVRGGRCALLCKRPSVPRPAGTWPILGFCARVLW